MRKVLQQGQADGLCGLYAALNFLNTTEWRSWSENGGLWYMLDACRHFGWLTPQFLIDGYEDHQIKAILDLQFTNYRMSYTTYFLSDVLSVRNDHNFQGLLEGIVAKGGSAIVHWETRGHWLLVTGDRDGPVVCDSDDRTRPKSPLSKRRIASTEWGVVILPSKRPKLQLDF